jgi:hypothetical protein
MKRKARNTIFNLHFNEDYKPGGRFYHLSDDAFRAYHCLEAYSDGDGYVRKPNGKGYTSIELQTMLNMNYRAIRKSFTALTSAGLIKISFAESSSIYLRTFVEDNTIRHKGCC